MKQWLSQDSWNGQAWQRNTAVGRWYGLGRWYAMFPPAFARDAILNLTLPGEKVLDPFCGRGNAPFAAAVLGRASFGVDVHPLAWLWTQAKLEPESDVQRVLDRLATVSDMVRDTDCQGGSEFECMAWAPKVRAFLYAARRELDWHSSITDRTLMAFIALHMQDKRGAGLSNQLSPTVAYSPDYSVRWWTAAQLTDPPDIDPVVFLSDRIRRRYECGVPVQAKGSALLGDARDALRSTGPLEAALLLTSPPYYGVTDYWNEHWIRLWILGYEMHKDWKRTARYDNSRDYRQLLNSVFREARNHLTRGGAVLVRCDQRTQTASVCIEALHKAWPRRRLFVRTTVARQNGVSAEHGRGGSRAKELDLLIPGNRGASWRRDGGFRPYEAWRSA